MPVPPLVNEIDSGEAVENSLKYLEELSPGVKKWAKAITQATLAFTRFLVDENVLGFDVIRAEKGGPDSKPWWICGELDKSLMEYLEEFGYYGSRHAKVLSEADRFYRGMSVLEKPKERPTSGYAKEALRSAMRVVKQGFSEWQYIPYARGKKGMEPGKYPVRKILPQDALVRLVSEEGFVDIPMAFAEILFEDVPLRGNTVSWSSVEQFLVEGETARIALPPFEKHKISEWDEVNSLLTEPPLLALSIGKMKEGYSAKWRLGDPHILVHIHLEVDDAGKLRSLNGEFSHSLNGVPGMQELYAGIVEDLFKYESGEKSEIVPEILKMREEAYPESGDTEKDTKESEEKPGVKVKLEVEKFDDEKNKTLQEETFSDDPLMFEFAKYLNILQVNCEINTPPKLAEYIRKNAKFFGGNIVISTLAGLLVSGQATMFAVESDKNGLQVGLGLGGTNFYANIRGIVSIFTEKKNKPDNFTYYDIIGVKEFIKNWKIDWEKLIKSEIKRAKNGWGTMTTLAAATGVGLRDTVQNLANVVVPGLSNFSLGRWMVSSLGKPPKVLDKFFEKISFYTARSRVNAVVVGEIGNVISLQFFARDPIMWGESIWSMLGSMLESHNTELLLDYIDVLGKIKNSREYTKYGISEKAIISCANWLNNLKKIYDLDQEKIRFYHQINEKNIQY